MRSLGGFVKFLCLLAFTGLLVSACSSSNDAAPAAGGSSKTLSGVAAAGAPIVGSVTIRDSSTPYVEKTVPIEANGQYTVDVSDLKAPYMVRADGYVGGNEYHLYSAGTEADVGGTINITPLTDLIMANIAGTIASDYFNGNNFTGLTATQLTEETTALRVKLLPILQAVGLSDSIDLLRASFNTDHTGLDAALDILKVDTVAGVATITNVITQEQITSTLATGSYSATMTNTTNVTEGVTAIQAITAGFTTFSNLFANSLPPGGEANATLLSLFDQTPGGFMQGGQDLAGFLGEIATDPDMIGVSFTNISIREMDVAAVPPTAIVAFDVFFNGVLDNEAPEAFHMIKTEGTWKMQGNLEIADVEVKTTAQYNPSEVQPNLALFTPIYTGIYVHIGDRGGMGITSAVVTGAGLPDPQGLTLVNNIENHQFEIQGQNGSLYAMTDEQIAQIADTGEVYTIKLYIGAELQATYTRKLRSHPYLNSELTVDNFPRVTETEMQEMMDFVLALGNGGTASATMNWIMPTGVTGEWLNLGINGSQGDSAMAEYSLAPGVSSKYITITATGSNGPFNPTGGWVWLAGKDSLGRRLATSFWFNENNPI